MPRRNSIKKERRHVHLHEGDWEWLIATYGSQRISPSAVISQLVSAHRRRVEDRIAQRIDSLKTPEDSLDDITPDTEA